MQGMNFQIGRFKLLKNHLLKSYGLGKAALKFTCQNVNNLFKKKNKALTKGDISADSVPHKKKQERAYHPFLFTVLKRCNGLPSRMHPRRRIPKANTKKNPTKSSSTRF